MHGLPPGSVQSGPIGTGLREIASDPGESVYWRAVCLGRNDRGLMLLAPDGRIRAINEAGRTYLATAEALITVQQRLACRASHDQLALRTILGDIGCGARTSGVMRFDANVVMTLDRAWLSARAPYAVLAAVYSEGGPSPDAVARWQQLFGLSPAEARIAEFMRKGRDDRSIGDQMGVTLHTIRSYAKTVHGKTGTRTRAELAYLLSRILVF